MEQKTNRINDALIAMMIPEDIRNVCEIKKIEEWDLEWNIHLVEKKELIPEKISHLDTVLNWFMNKIELISFPAQDKAVYFQILRRRWKIRGTNQDYFNEYDFYYKGLKITKNFGNFLKEITRQERRKFFATFPNIRNISEKDF